MERAANRKAYHGVAADLQHAATLPGGRERALAAAQAMRDEYPRRPALHDELRSAGLESR